MTRTKVKIPRGWRRLRGKVVMREGDNYYHDLRGKWEFIPSYMVGVGIDWYLDYVVIRPSSIIVQDYDSSELEGSF